MHIEKSDSPPYWARSRFYGAGNETRTRYLHLGKVALYQMSYARETRIILANLCFLVKSFAEDFYVCALRATVCAIPAGCLGIMVPAVGVSKNSIKPASPSAG